MAEAHKIWQWPGINQRYFAPTCPQIRDIFYPTTEEVAYAMGLRIRLKHGDHEVEVYEGLRYRGTVIYRSMEKPETIVGFKIGHALIDELDVMPLKKAQTAWRKIIARMRYKVPGLMNSIDVTMTPEGFKFVYQPFVKAIRDKPELASLYGLIQASTFDNELNLPDDYIPSLMASYAPRIVPLVQRIATAYGKATDRFTLADLDLANLAAFDAAHPQLVGLYVADRMSQAQAIQQLAASVGAQALRSRTGQLRLVQIAPPAAGVPVQIGPEHMKLDSLRPVQRLGEGWYEGHRRCARYAAAGESAFQHVRIATPFDDPVEGPDDAFGRQ